MKSFNQLSLFILTLLLMIVITGMDDSLLAAEHYIDMNPSFDLVVYGGDPEGVIAALAGARNGLKTLLVMEEDGPGGLLVYGALNFLDLNYDEKSQVIHKGIFGEWHQMVGNGVIVNIEESRLAFMKLLLAEPHLTIALTTRLKEFQLSADLSKIERLTFETVGVSKSHDQFRLNQITTCHPAWSDAVASLANSYAKLWLLPPGTVWEVSAKCYIDASQDADLAVKVGVPFFVGGADIGLPERKMAVTLVFRVKNVDWKAFEKEVKTNKWGDSRVTDTAAWGFAKIGAQYQPVDPMTRLRGLNIARQNDNTVFINALQIFNLDVLDQASLQKGMEQGKAEAAHIVKYLCREVAGFHEAELMDFPSQLYIRESRHILALYQLDILDLVEKVDFPDKIAISSYPVDFQATAPDQPGYVIITPGIYSIPFRSLVPREKVNILVVGRSAGYSSLAAGSVRVIPTGMATAEAAGMAAALSIEKGVNFHQIAQSPTLIQNLQQRLIQRQVALPQIEGKNKLAYSSEYQFLKELFSWGMLSAGYDNNLRLDQVITEREFAYLLAKGMRQRKAFNYTESLVFKLNTITGDRPLYTYKASEILLTAWGYPLLDVEDSYLTALKEAFPLSPTDRGVSANVPLTRRDIYRLATPFFKRYPIPEHLNELRTRPFGE